MTAAATAFFASDKADRDERVRAALRSGRTSQAEAAREFGLSKRQVERIATAGRADASAERATVRPSALRAQVEIAIARHWPDLTATCRAAGATPREVRAVLAELDALVTESDHPLSIPRPRPCLEP